MKTDGTRVMCGNLYLKSRSIINVKQARHMKAHMLILILSIQLSTIIIIIH